MKSHGVSAAATPGRTTIETSERTAIETLIWKSCWTAGHRALQAKRLSCLDRRRVAEDVLERAQISRAGRLSDLMEKHRDRSARRRPRRGTG